MLTRRAALGTAAAFAITPDVATASEGMPPGCNWPAVRARFIAVARVFHVPTEEIIAALGNGDVMMDTLTELFMQHGVSMTWVLTGTGPLVHEAG